MKTKKDFYSDKRFVSFNKYLDDCAELFANITEIIHTKFADNETLDGKDCFEVEKEVDKVFDALAEMTKKQIWMQNKEGEENEKRKS